MRRCRCRRSTTIRRPCRAGSRPQPRSSVRYAPQPLDDPPPEAPPREARPSEGPAPRAGATKLTPYLPSESENQKDDGEPATSPAGTGASDAAGAVAPTAKGYAVPGFTPNYKPDVLGAPIVVMAVPFSPKGFGDAAGEHLAMKRAEADRVGATW